MVFLLVITTPVVDYDEELHKWNRYLNSLQLTTGLLFASLATKGLLLLFFVARKFCWMFLVFSHLHVSFYYFKVCYFVLKIALCHGVSI